MFMCINTFYNISNVAKIPNTKKERKPTKQNTLHSTANKPTPNRDIVIYSPSLPLSNSHCLWICIPVRALSFPRISCGSALVKVRTPVGCQVSQADKLLPES